MRVNNIGMFGGVKPASHPVSGKIANGAQAARGINFGSGEIFDWSKDPDLATLTPKEKFDAFIREEMESGETTPEEEFDESINRIFAENNDGEEDKKPKYPILTINVYDDVEIPKDETGDNISDENSDDSKIVPKKHTGTIVKVGLAGLAGAYIIATSLLSLTALGEIFGQAQKQNELQNMFKENPEAVAEELIGALGMDEAAVDNLLHPFGTLGSLGGVISGSSSLAEEIDTMPIGGDTEIVYFADNFLSVPGTTYQAALDIDGDKNPEISLWMNGDGYVNVFYDYDSDGKIDAEGLYDAYLGALQKNEANKTNGANINTIAEK